MKTVLDLVTVKFAIPGLHKAITVPGASAPMEAVFKFNWLSAAGTAIFIASILSALILRVSFADFVATFAETLRSLRYPLVTIASVLGFAYVANYSGISKTLGLALTFTGIAFPFLSAVIGWLGVFITGSDTSSNALFGKLQMVAAEKLKIPPVLAVAANSSGGVTGKMISPQSIAVATAAVGLVGKEGELFRRTLFYSITFAAFIGALTCLQAYFLRGMVPEAVKAAEAAAGGAASTASGLMVLLGVFVFVLLLWAVVAVATAPQRRSAW